MIKKIAIFAVITGAIFALFSAVQAKASTFTYTLATSNESNLISNMFQYLDTGLTDIPTIQFYLANVMGNPSLYLYHCNSTSIDYSSGNPPGSQCSYAGYSTSIADQGNTENLYTWNLSATGLNPSYFYYLFIYDSAGVKTLGTTNGNLQIYCDSPGRVTSNVSCGIQGIFVQMPPTFVLNLTYPTSTTYSSNDVSLAGNY